MSHDDKHFKLAIEVNRALQSADANQIIKAVVKFMEHHGIRADPNLVKKIPTQ